MAVSGAPDEALPDDATAKAAPASTEASASAPATASAATSGASASQGGQSRQANNGANVATIEAPAQETHGGNGDHGANGGRIFISPIARRIAAEHGLDIARLHGSGPGGRIIREDVEAALEQQETGQHPAVTITADGAIAVSAAGAAGAEVEAVPLTQMRKTIARRLQQSMQTAPHFYVTLAIDATRLGEFRAAVNEYAGSLPQPVKVSFNDLIVKAVAQTLRLMPQVNVSFDGERLLYKKQINVGVAVALESGPNQGLIVPVVRDADKRGVLDIARETRRLGEAARNGSLKPDDIQGGTFTVSNLGMYGVESFTAIINPPESAILAVGAIIPTPVVVDRQMVVRDQMRVTLSVDHRALDGATAARFLQELKRLLEQPMAMLL